MENLFIEKRSFRVIENDIFDANGEINWFQSKKRMVLCYNSNVLRYCQEKLNENGKKVVEK